MLKRTITLVGLTITAAALLLTIGCSGGNSNPVATMSNNQPLVSRQANQPPSNPQIRIDVTIWGHRYVGVRAVDPEGDRLKYKVVLQGPANHEFDQSQGTGQWYTTPWSNTPVSDFANGRWGFVRLPALPSGAYTITVQAFDGNSWSSNSSLSFRF